MIPKKYKPGQLITINHKIYRIKKTRSSCVSCAFYDDTDICWGLLRKTKLERQVCFNLYPKLVFECINQDS